MSTPTLEELVAAVSRDHEAYRNAHAIECRASNKLDVARIEARRQSERLRKAELALLKAVKGE